MLITQRTKIIGLDMEATTAYISELIKESGMTDKQLGEAMNLSVQSINKWRHGHSIPDIENMYILSRMLGKRLDDMLIPMTAEDSAIGVETEVRRNPFLLLRRLGGYLQTQECVNRL